jgi:hypothetical protein
MEPILKEAAKAFIEGKKLALYLTTERIPVRVGGIDCTEEKALCEEFQATGLPTIKLYVKFKLVLLTSSSAHGQVSEWTSGRAIGDFLSFGRSLRPYFCYLFYSNS